MSPTARRLRQSPWLLLFLALAGAGPAAAQVAFPTAAAEVQAGTPETLFVWNRPIVELRATIDGATPAERVARAKRRISDLSTTVDTSHIRAVATTVGTRSGVLVGVGSQFLFAILPEDLDPLAGVPLADAGNAAAHELALALQSAQDQRRLPVILRGIAVSILATVLLVFLLRLVGRIRRRAIERPVTGRFAERIRLFGVDLGTLLTSLDRAIVNITAPLVMAAAVFIWLTIVLTRFPITRPLGMELDGYIRVLLGSIGTHILDAIPGLFAVAIIFFLARLAAQGLSGLFQSVESGHLELSWLDAESAKATRRLVIGLVWVFAIVLAYPFLPAAQTPAFKGVSVLLGLMVTLGSTGLVNHFMSGLVIIYSRACHAGEVIKVQEIEGMVTRVGLLSTKIRTLKLEEITVPNAVLVGHPITNYSRLTREEGLVVSTTVTIGYDAPWRQVHEMLVHAASRTAGIEPTPAPFVLQRALSDFYVEYELRFRLKELEKRVAVLSQLHAEIQDAFNAAGVQIMSPHFEGQPEGKVWVPKAQWKGAPPPA